MLQAKGKIRTKEYKKNSPQTDNYSHIIRKYEKQTNTINKLIYSLVGERQNNDSEVFNAPTSHTAI